MFVYLKMYNQFPIIKLIPYVNSPTIIKHGVGNYCLFEGKYLSIKYYLCFIEYI